MAVGVCRGSTSRDGQRCGSRGAIARRGVHVSAERRLRRKQQRDARDRRDIGGATAPRGASAAHERREAARAPPLDLPSGGRGGGKQNMRAYYHALVLALRATKIPHGPHRARLALARALA